MRIVRAIAFFVATLPLLVSCTHKELCFDHHHTARVRIQTDWSAFTVEKPTGMSVNVYDENGDIVRNALSNNISFVDVELEPGRYNTLAFNQSPSEFGSVDFSGLDKWNEAMVMSIRTKSIWFKSDNDPVMLEPEWIGTDTRNDVTVSMDMLTVSPQIRNTRGSDFPESNVIATLTPQNIIYTITVMLRIKGVHNLKSARASLDGLASGYMLGEGHPSASTGVELLEEWTLTRETMDPTVGYIKAEITSFGLPYGHKARPQDNVLNLSLLLVDNKTKLDFSFSCGDSFIKDKDDPMRLILCKELDGVLPDVKPENGSAGGFDAKVDDWGDEEIIDIPV